MELHFQSQIQARSPYVISMKSMKGLLITFDSNLLGLAAHLREEGMRAEADELERIIKDNPYPPALGISKETEEERLARLAQFKEQRDIQLAQYAESIRLLQEKRNVAHQKRNDVLNNYGIVSVSCSRTTPLAFEISLSTAIDKKIPPVVQLNNVVAPVAVIGTNVVLCYVTKVLATPQKILTFSCGESVREIDNPFYLERKSNEFLSWYSKGEAENRKIIFPAKNFLCVAKDHPYPFALYVGKSMIGEFQGRCNSQSEIIIPTGKRIHARDCVNKDSYICPTFQRSEKFFLVHV